SYAQVQLREGRKTGRLLQAFKENIDRPLAAILTLNTIAHTVGAIGVGEQAAKIWADANPLITGLAVPALMTLGILVLSELIPKTLGANYWQELAPFTVKSLRLVINLLAPLVWFSQFVTRALKKDKDKSVFSRLDFLAMAELGAQQGVFDRQESHFISNLLRFEAIQAKDIMTPRTVVVAAPEDRSIEAFLKEERDMRFSRIPVYEQDSKDQVTGYVRKDEVLARLLDEEVGGTLADLRRDILAVAESFPIPELFNHFLEKREHIAVVLDDFGGMSGIVTMEDVIETLLGMEIMDELDKAEDMQALARRNWETRAKRLGLIEPAAETAEPTATPEQKPDGSAGARP
ncbi:MAG: hemolysin family protein, partial [Chromatiaceae bacterium]|nr:hemolysin family protein [Chromatiaceae bacterium]